MFRREGDSSSLSLQSLTIRTVMLFALTRPCRGTDLAALNLSSRAYRPEGIIFTPTQLSKQSRPACCNVVSFFPSFQEDKRLCPVEALKAYEAKTSEFCKDRNDTCLFRSFIGEHKPVCSSTIARWLKSCLQKTGVDTLVFQAHSTRAASSTKAVLSGLTVKEIMSAADWSSKGTFQKFYYKPSYSATFGSAVLAANCVSKSHVDMET